MKSYDESFATLFPPSWRVAHALTADFCSISHAHLEEILDQSRGALDVPVLTHALQRTTEFELEVHNRFVNRASAAISGDGSDAGAADEADGVERPATFPPLLKSVSSAFDSYM